MNALRLDRKIRVVSALVDGCSIRATERLCEVHRDTIMRLAVLVGEACQRLHDCLVRDVQVSLLELDELHSFVGKRQRRLKPDEGPERGDQYLYLGIDAVKKAIISFAVGKRTAATTNAFARDLRSRITNRPEIYTDGFVAYVDAVGLAFGPDVDYAMLIKKPGAGRWDEVLGSPADQSGPRRIAIAGNPNLSRLTTNHSERANLTVRMSVRRFTRKTNGFSKKLRSHRAAVALHVAHYNFCRVHEALKITPAMAIGVTEHVWSIGELIDAALSVAPPAPAPGTPRPPDRQLDEAMPAEPEQDQPGGALAGAARAAPAPPALSEAAQFEARVNETAVALGSAMRARDPALSQGVNDIHDYWLTEHVSMVVAAPRGTSRISSVTMFAGGDGTWESVLNVLQGMTLVIEALAGPNSLQERLRIFKKLGVRWRDGGGSWDGKVTVKGWVFSVRRSDETSVWLVAQKSS